MATFIYLFLVVLFAHLWFILSSVCRHYAIGTKCSFETIDFLLLVAIGYMNKCFILVPSNFNFKTSHTE